MSTTKNTHGGARPGAGRPASTMVKTTVRLTPDQAAKLRRLGGAEWLRAHLDALQLVEYFVDGALSGFGLEKEIADCYDDRFLFEAVNDAEAVAYCDRLQEKHDRAAARVLNEAERREDPRAWALAQSLDESPVYSAHLFRDARPEEDPDGGMIRVDLDAD